MPPRLVRRTMISIGAKVAMSANPRAAVPSLMKLNQILKKRQNLVVPQSEEQKNMKFASFITSTYSVGDYGQIEELPPFDNLAPPAFNELFRKYVLQCKIKCNFVDSLADVKNINMKSKYLKQIISLFKTAEFFKIVDSHSLKDYFDMFKSNVIRYTPPFPPLAKVPMMGDDITDSVQEASWPHLELVYTSFQTFLEAPNMDPKTFADNITQTFIRRLVGLFSSCDSRERSVIKILVHRLYLRFNFIRPVIRSEMQNILYTFLFEEKFFPGVNEILEIFMSIINGYAVPLRKEHVTFFKTVLIPLHSSDYYHIFSDNLAICVGQYVQKDATLMLDFFNGLIAYWPNTSSVKEIMFIEQIDHILEVLTDEQFNTIKTKLFNKIGELVQSNAFRVSEAAILLFRNDRFVELTLKFSKDVLPIICPCLYNTGMEHWNSAIKNLAVSAIRMCMDTVNQEDPKAFNATIQKNGEEAKLKVQRKKQIWIEIENQAFENDPELKQKQQQK